MILRAAFLFLTSAFLLCSGNQNAVPGGDLLIADDVPPASDILSSSPQELKAAQVDRHLVVLTLDGTLHCVGQRSGSLLWQTKDDPLIKVTQENLKEFLLIPNPKDGSLFAYDGAQLTKYPFSIPQLVALSPSRTANGYLYAGSKRDVWLAINMTSGERVETVSLERGFDRQCPAKEGHPDEISEIAYIGRSEYSLGVFDSSSRLKKWYGSYLDYASHTTLDVQDYDLRHLTSSTGGQLATTDENTGNILWEKDFGSPVAAVFLWDAAGLQRVPFTTFSQDALSLLVDPKGPSRKFREMSFRQRTKFLAPSIQAILFVGSSQFGTYTMPTLAINQESQKLLSEDVIPLISAGTVQVSENPQDETNLQGYYTMPQKTTDLAPMYPAHIDILSFYYSNDKNEPPKGLPGPASKDSEPDTDHLASFAFYLFSLIFAILAAVGTSYYFAKKPRADVNSSVTQTTRGHVSELTDASGKRVYHVGKLEFYPDSILGYGSAGTIVYEGRFDGRKVAVKRLVPELCGLAEKEAQLLRLSDKHSNVIRYFLTERDSHFCYLALELAMGTLADYVEGKLAEKCPLEPLQIVEQAMHGLQHLHSLSIVHRDLKPANVLLSMPDSRNGPNAKVRAMISDFGLCKRISHSSSWVAKSSTMNRTIGGTEGWIAPEILAKCFPENGQQNAVDCVIDNKTPNITPAVDIFSAGCLLYFAMTKGKHPFGEPLRRQVNIQCGKTDFFELLNLGNYTAKDLCEWMVSSEPGRRPTVNECLFHPTFWPLAKQLSFLLDVSDRLEKVQPGDGCPALSNLERGASYIVNFDWRRHVGEELQAELRTHRSYRGNSVRDLLRAIRNKKHHYQELPADVKASLGEMPGGFLLYFTSRFPRLLIHVYRSASCIGDEPLLASYYCKTPRVPSVPSNASLLTHTSSSDSFTPERANDAVNNSSPSLHRRMFHQNSTPKMNDSFENTKPPRRSTPGSADQDGKPKAIPLSLLMQLAQKPPPEPQAEQHKNDATED